MRFQVTGRLFRYVRLMAVVLTVAFAMPGLAIASPFSNLKPADPQPDAAALAPGLAVDYYGVLVNSLRELEGHMKYMEGKAGPPLPMLNYSVGMENVLTSNSDDMVGADINGFIHMKEPGRYVFLVHSNDGVRVTIGGQMIFEDPDVHADRFSDEIIVEISEPGWYPIHVLYFEKRNTSTLELYWEAPGYGDMDFVPAEAFSHLRE